MNVARTAGSKVGFRKGSLRANPYPAGSVERLEWNEGWEEGFEARSMVRAHESRLYHNDRQHFTSLWN